MSDIVETLRWMADQWNGGEEWVQVRKTVAPDIRKAADEIERLKAERDALKTELHIAVGMLSTQPNYSAKHPMDVLQIVKDAAIDAARGET